MILVYRALKQGSGELRRGKKPGVCCEFVRSGEFSCWAVWAQLAAFVSQLLGIGWKEGDSSLGFAQEEMADVLKDNIGRLEGGLHSMRPKAGCDVLFPGPLLLCVMLPCSPVVFSVLSHLCLPSSTPQASMTFTCPSTATWPPLSKPWPHQSQAWRCVTACG